MLKINSLRKEYTLKSLNENDVLKDPFLLFKSWFSEASQVVESEVNAMTLATATLDGKPSCRMVLLKEMDHSGFIFFTNKDSRKGSELAINPFGCLLFFWKELERQIIIEGSVSQIPPIESDKYFSQRPVKSQIGAWASHQDKVIASRHDLEKSFSHFSAIYQQKSVPRPPYWGGYKLIPNRFEFWQGRESRLHDRLQFLLNEGKWAISRLSP